MATQPKKPRSVDEYIAQFEPPIKAILQCVRAAVREGAPSATEVISYRMPALRQNGILVYFAAFKGHIGLYPPIRGDAELEARASAYAGEKGNLRFPYTEPIPYKLITALTRLQAKQDRYRMGRMKSYANFDEYLKAQSPKNQAIIRALRKFVKRVAPTLSEAVKWGNGCWIGSKGPVAYVYSDTQYVQFGFFNGSSLKDPKDLLEGKGKYVRHIKVGSPSAIDEPAFAALLLQAAQSRHAFHA